MTVSKFILLVTQKEGKKREVNVAQISEIVRVINDLTKGNLYKLIKLI